MTAVAPIVAECYKYTATDGVTPFSTTDPGGDVALANAIDPNLMFVAHTADAGDLDGFLITLAANVALSGIEVVNCEMASTERLRVIFYSDAGTTIVANTAMKPGVASEVWTAHSEAPDFAPTRVNWILGVDTLGSGPTPAATPIPTTVSTKAVLVDWQSGVSRTFWEAAFVGMMQNARALGHPAHGEGTELDVDMIQLRSGGTGYRWTLNWDRLSMDDVAFMRAIVASSDHGNWPIFFYPDAGQKTSSGTLTEERLTQGGRGGLARLLSFKASEQQLAGSTYYGRNCTLVAESWQEEAAG